MCLVRFLQFENKSMQGSVLIMCKLLILLLWYHGFYFKINDPFLPFIPALDYLNLAPGVFRTLLRVLFVISTMFLFSNYKVRVSSLTLGLVVILTMVSSKPIYSNHTLICGCALFLAGISDSKKYPKFLLYQVSLMYFGAFLNKFMDTDWQSGVYMDNWLRNVRFNAIYIEFASILPNLFVAKMLSWGAFITELVIGVALLTKKYRTFAIWAIIIFHTTIFTFTFLRFGHFFESIIIITIGLMKWPDGNIHVNIKESTYKIFKKFVCFFDYDKKIIWGDLKQLNSHNISLTINQNQEFGLKAIKDIILYTPAFYFILFFIDMVFSSYLIYVNYRIAFVLNVLLIWTIIFCFLPKPSFLINIFARNKKAPSVY